MRKPEVSLGLGLALGTLVLGIYKSHVPEQANVRVGAPNDPVLDTSRTQALWMSATAVAGISLLTKDRTVFILGAATIVGVDWVTRANNYHNLANAVKGANPFAVEKPATVAPTGEGNVYDMMAVN